MNLSPESEPSIQEQIVALKAERRRLSQILQSQEEGWVNAYWQIEEVGAEIRRLEDSIPSSGVTRMVGEETLRLSSKKRCR